MGRARHWFVAVVLLCALALVACGSAAGARSSAKDVRGSLSITEDFRDAFMHGEKGASYQRFIVMHDSEGDGSAAELVDFWEASGSGAASHFVVNRDGTIVQCVPLDAIAHHAGFGDAGHNDAFGVREDGRDDRAGTVPLGDEFPDYGMNSYSVGITMVHRGDAGEEYPEAQLEAVDGLIAYIDAYYGSKSTIIEHKEWRTGCEGCSAEFAPYLAALKATRRHDGVVESASGTAGEKDAAEAAEAGGNEGAGPGEDAAQSQASTEDSGSVEDAGSGEDEEEPTAGDVEDASADTSGEGSHG